MQDELSLIENTILVGECIPLGELALYPIARLSIIKAPNESIRSIWLSPVGLIVTGPGFDVPFEIAINNEKINLDNLYLPLDLRKLLDNRKQKHR
jgi:hypothetical protein